MKKVFERPLHFGGGMRRAASAATFVLLAVLTLLSASPPARAVVPGTISYQGFLTSNTGAPVSGSVSITFKLYTQQTAGTAIWSETQSVPVSNGFYTVLLGAVTSLNSVAFSAPYFLGVTVGTDSEMTPRQALSSAPYALRAAIAESVVGQPTATTITRSVTDASAVGSSACGTGEILVGGGCDCTGRRSTGTNYGIVFSCSPAGQSMVGGCFDHLYSSSYGPSPIVVRAICLAGIQFKASAEDVGAVEAALKSLRDRKEEMSRLNRLP